MIVIFCAAAVAAPKSVIAEIASVELNLTAPPVADAEEIPETIEITPVPAVAPVSKAMVGLETEFTEVAKLSYVKSPKAVIAEAVCLVPQPVITELPCPVEDKLPVATVVALDAATATVESEYTVLVAVTLVPVAIVFGVHDITRLSVLSV